MEWIDDISQDKENVFGREGGKFILRYAEIFKASSCCIPGFYTDSLFSYTPNLELQKSIANG